MDKPKLTWLIAKKGIGLGPSATKLCQGFLRLLRCRAQGAQCVGLLRLALLSALSGTGLAAGAIPVEYAIRWDPSQGGPANAAATLALLKLTETGRENFSVRYFDVTLATPPPQGFQVVARRRIKGKKTQLTLKIRSEVGDAIAAPAWTCPLGVEAKSKDEVDVTLYSGQPLTNPPQIVKRVMSLSCTISSISAIEFDAKFVPRERGCLNEVLRLESDEVTVEEWTSKGVNGNRTLEVSMRTEDTAATLEEFRKRIAGIVEASNAQLVDRSKTEIGVACQ